VQSFSRHIDKQRQRLEKSRQLDLLRQQLPGGTELVNERGESGARQYQAHRRPHGDDTGGARRITQQGNLAERVTVGQSRQLPALARRLLAEIGARPFERRTHAGRIDLLAFLAKLR